ncbi:helix-turn-helix transcriptional regulator [Rhodanobacter sp. UC4436_H3]
MLTHQYEKLLSSAPVRVTTKVAAEYLGVSVRTLEDWRAKGKGPKYMRIGHRIRYEISELDTFIAAGRR